MRIAISSAGPDLDAEVDPRFGRCRYFIIADPMTSEFEVTENTNASAAGGAGIATAQMIVKKGAAAILTGNCGPNAHQVLSAAHTDIITGVSGRIRDVIEEYKLGTYTASKSPNVADHYGMGAGGGGSMGAGGGGGMSAGRGMGRGMGRGRGRGGGMGRGIQYLGPASSQGTAPEEPAAQDLESLQSQAQVLARQMQDIQRRINEIEE